MQSLCCNFQTDAMRYRWSPMARPPIPTCTPDHGRMYDDRLDILLIFNM